MSHKATQWLSGLDPKLMTAGAFRVMFHLCDCHNPSLGCFPSQEYLRNMTGLSNSGLNKVLQGLENSGLIQRKRRVDRTTRRQMATRYILAFEQNFDAKSNGGNGEDDEGSIPQNQEPSGASPTPLSGDGSGADPTPKSGDGPDSTFGAIPTPLLGQSRLHLSGDKPVREPVNKTRARPRRQSNSRDVLADWAKKVRAQKNWIVPHISPEMARQMLDRGLVDHDQLKGIGVAW